MSNPYAAFYPVAAIAVAGAQPPVQMSGAKEDLSDQVIMGAWGDASTCNESNASSISFDDAASGRGVKSGDCIAMTAYWKGGAIYANEADANVAKSVVTPKLEGRRVGIYADERTSLMAPRRPTPFKVVGFYASCATEWSGAMMVLGYCHFSDGPFVKVSQTRRARRRDVR